MNPTRQALDREVRFEIEVVPPAWPALPGGVADDPQPSRRRGPGAGGVGAGLRRVRSVHPGTNAHAWLPKILANTFISGYRKRRREPLMDLGADPAADWQPGAGPLAGTAPSAEAEALERLAGSEVLAARRELPVEFREAVYLADVEG
jgi:RNA polymerase sigma-70 factor (ECF subfamily)